VLLRRLYMRFFIHHDGRLVRIAGATAKPATGWMTQRASNFSMELIEHTGAMKALNQDRDTKFAASLDAVFAAAGPGSSSPSGSRERTPSASASSVLFGASTRPPAHPQTTAPGSRPRRVIEHHNSHRSHRSLSQPTPLASEATLPHPGDVDLARLGRIDRMGGLIHDYTKVA